MLYCRFAEKLLLLGETVLEQIGEFFVGGSGFPLDKTLHRIVQVQYKLKLNILKLSFKDCQRARLVALKSTPFSPFF